jgi:hypothetical protein
LSNHTSYDVVHFSADDAGDMVLSKLTRIFLGLGACEEINPKAGAMVLAGSRHGPAQTCDLSMMNNTQESTFVFNR